MAGDMIQDLKVGHLLGGTPWKMEIAELVSVLLTSFFIVLPIMLLHIGNMDTGGIGGSALPAPQAGLMAMMAEGIIGGDMPWMLIFVGMFFSAFLISIEAPSPMLIAVGMYLPIETTSAIFVGGAMKWWLDRYLKRKKANDEQRQKVRNGGTLVASGFIAGEALCGVLLSGLALINIESIAKIIFGVSKFSFVGPFGGWLSLLVFAAVGYGLIGIPLRKMKKG